LGIVVNAGQVDKIEFADFAARRNRLNDPLALPDVDE